MITATALSATPGRTEQAWRSTSVVADESMRLAKAAQAALTQSQGTSSSLLPKPEGIEADLFNARAAFKIATASIAMHLPSEWRSKLFMQIDSLLASDDWDPRDKPPVASSGITLLRLILFLKRRRPGLGATSDGTFVATWTSGSDQLTVYCLPGDQVRWTLSIDNGTVQETAAGKNSIVRLPSVLAPYNPERWFHE